MLDILPNAESPAYSSLSDYRPLHVYIIHDQITIHLQLTYAELSTYSNACNTIKVYWNQLLCQDYPSSPMVLTNNLGAVIHKENWATFINARYPCLAWYGGKSLNRLLSEIRKKKDIISKHLAQLHVTEAVLHYAEERPINQVSLSEFGDPTDGNVIPADVQGDPLIQAWDLLNPFANDEYTAAVEQICHPNSVVDVFQQDTLEALLADISPPEATGLLTPDSAADNGESLGNDYYW